MTTKLNALFAIVGLLVACGSPEGASSSEDLTNSNLKVARNMFILVELDDVSPELEQVLLCDVSLKNPGCSPEVYWRTNEAKKSLCLKLVTDASKILETPSAFVERVSGAQLGATEQNQFGTWQVHKINSRLKLACSHSLIEEGALTNRGDVNLDALNADHPLDLQIPTRITVSGTGSDLSFVAGTEEAVRCDGKTERSCFKANVSIQLK
jgi:hypothetical protein